MITISFAWYDLWVGAYIDTKNRFLYVCPLPCFLIRIGPFGLDSEVRADEAPEDTADRSYTTGYQLGLAGGRLQERMLLIQQLREEQHSWSYPNNPPASELGKMAARWEDEIKDSGGVCGE